MAELEKEKIVGLLNHILEQELAGVVRYTHYSFLVFGHNRIPIVSWLREQAAESLTHAQQAGEINTMSPRSCVSRWRPKARPLRYIGRCSDVPRVAPWCLRNTPDKWSMRRSCTPAK